MSYLWVTKEKKIMKLISMTAFVLEQDPKINESHKVAEKAIESIFKYAKFLKQSLTLGMFIPCDENGNVLEQPLKEDYEVESDGFSIVYDAETYEYDVSRYSDAKERVLFENVSYAHAKWIIETYTYIDDITSIQRSMTPLELTPAALKQIGL